MTKDGARSLSRQLVRPRLELAKSNAVSPGKGGKQPDIVGLIVQRRLRDRPRLPRPRAIALKIRFGRPRAERRHEIPLTQRERRRTEAAVCRRPSWCAAARINRELRI